MSNDDLLFARVASQLFGCPLLLRQHEAEIIGGYVRARMLGTAPEANRFQGQEQADDNTRRWKGYRKEGSVGVVSILGELVNRGAWLGASSGLTSYEGIAQQLRNAVSDKDVKSIILDIQSPGGQAIGMNETARLIREISKEKKVTAVVNAMAASAAYGLASGANEIVVTESGIAGSIGVVLVHHDRSRQLDNAGIKSTVFKAGEEKAVGNPFEPLSRKDEDILQGEVDQIMKGFVKLVASHRPKLSEQSIRDLKAGIRIGEEAVNAGLADRLGSFESVLTDLTRASGRSTSQPRRTSMSENNGAPAANEDAGIPKATHDAAVKQARTEGKAEGVAEGTKAGAEAERTRLAAIISAEGIKGNAARLTAALELATESPEMAADKVAAFAVKNVAEGASAALADRAAQPDSLARAGTQQQAPKANSWGDFRAKRAG
ncbi:S49 family peptidase [Mesorhizobium sp. M0514]|uniref:S49 family peptidase n=1 Tax=Mesorhizobium sp. M0514 TaxID=2956955 RepID=UPI0033379815